MLIPADRPDLLAKFERDYPESTLDPLPVKRGPRKPTTDVEAPVIHAVGQLLEAHPQVLFAVRQNSGAASYDRDGRPIPVKFYRLLKTPEDMTIVDFWGLLRGGRFYAIEAKKPSWTKPGTDHERKQAAFLRMVECIGGAAGFVRSADEAKALLG